MTSVVYRVRGFCAKRVDRKRCQNRNRSCHTGTWLERHLPPPLVVTDDLVFLFVVVEVTGCRLRQGVSTDGPRCDIKLSTFSPLRLLGQFVKWVTRNRAFSSNERVPLITNASTCDYETYAVNNPKTKTRNDGWGGATYHSYFKGGAKKTGAQTQP